MIKIKDIYWERVNLHLVLDTNLSNYNIYLASKEKMLKLSSDNNEIVINVTNTPEGEMFDAGKWQLIIDKKEIDHKKYLKDIENETFVNNVTVDDSVFKILDDKSRIFRYRGGVYAYTIYFTVNNNLFFYIHTRFMVENRKWKKFFRFSETGIFYKKIIIFFKKCYLFFINFYYKTMRFILRLFKFSHKKNVLFLTENSDALNGNLKVLYDSITDDECNKYYYTNDKYSHKNNKFYKKPLRYLHEINLIAKSDVIFVDNYTPKLTHINISKKCRLVQLWHAGIGFKSVGYARFGIEGSPHPYRSCHRRYTDAVVDQEVLIDIYNEVFGNRREIFKSTGIPRLDGYLDKDRIKKTTEKLFKKNQQLKTKKVILFSPTYRGTNSETAFYDYSLIDLKTIYDFCKKNNFIFIVKMHPFIKESISIPKEYANLIYDYSTIDINDLIYVTDIMITDYSSCAYEYSLFDRPLIFYRFDKELYEYLRPMHSVKAFTSKQSEVKTFDELMKVLEENKNVNINDRFKHIKKQNNKNACEEIKKLYITGD